jgi:5-methyltetrahydrofolate--homocysteine methyltransferase
MDKVSQLLTAEPYILLDGAMGTMLFEMGLESGNPPEEWNLLHPDRILTVHRSYIAAGSQLVLTNSFGGSAFRLKMHGLHERVVEINRAAAQIARAAADEASRQVIVGGSMGPTGELLTPLGTMTNEEARSAFAEQASGLVSGGVDLLWVETMSDLEEVRAAVEGVRSVTGLPVVATMTFDTNGHTMMGVSPVAAVQALSQLDLLALGGNCGNGPVEVENAIKAMRAANSALLYIAKSNAGLPKWIDNHMTYDGTPEVMADYAVRVQALGARLIGACCGSTPDHVRAMATALAERPSSKVAPLAEPAAVPGRTAPGRRGRIRERRRRR